MSVQIKGVGTISGIDQGLNIVGTTTTGQLNVTGVSTFVGDVQTTAGNILVKQPAGTDATITINEGTTTNGLFLRQTATESLIQTGASHPLNIRAQSGSGSTQHLAFWTKDSERLRITSAGDIGINTTAPQNAAHFQHFQSTARHQSFQSNLGDLSIVSDNNTNPVAYIKGTGTADLLNVFDNTDEVFTILDAGKVGINAASPTTNLQIGGSAVDSNNVITFGKRVACDQSNLPLIGHHSVDGVNSGLGLCATSTSGTISFFTGNNANGFGEGSNNEYMRIQSNGEIAMRSSGSPTDALSGLHVQNGNLRVSQAAGPTTEYFQVQAHTHNVDGDRHVLSNYSNGTLYSHITKSGIVGSLSSHFAGRTKTDANSPSNYYAHGSFSFNAYSGNTNDTSTYRAMIFMRAWDAGDDGDRNILYYVNSGSDTTAADYDAHQKFGVKADGSVHTMVRNFSGRVESDEATPDSVYGTGRGGYYAYESSGTSVMYMLAEAGGSNSTYFVFARTSNNDTQWRHRTSDGRMYVDATATTFSGADYAEYFEWSDGNSSDEDRVGYTVVLKDEGKIGIATAGDSPSSIIGVISSAPAIIGDGQDLSWRGKWKKDEFGREITTPVQYLVWNHGYEDDENGNRVPVKQPDPTHQMSMESADSQAEVGPKLDKMIADGHVPQYAIDNNIIMNARRRVHDPLYDETKKYVPREFRKEWSPVGLVGKLTVRKGQVMGDRWLKMKDINDQLEQWMVR